VAEHTVTQCRYQILPSYNGFILLVDAASAGCDVMIVLPPTSQPNVQRTGIGLAAFNHQTFTIKVRKWDSGPHIVSVVSMPGEPIDGGVPLSKGDYKVDITEHMQTLEFWTDGARWIISGTNGGIPQ
jgi:hypothetical protein